MKEAVMMRLWLKTIVAVMVLGIITLALIGCDKSFETGARENTSAFLRTLSCLNNRLSFHMPKGAQVMSRKQEKSLGLSQITNTVSQQRVAWGGSGEILTLLITDHFKMSSGDIEQDMEYCFFATGKMKNREYNKLNEYIATEALSLDQISYSREGELQFMNALIFTEEDTLISIEFSLYTTAFDRLEERIAFFKEVATGIVESATPGTRILGAEEQMVTFENYTIQIPQKYCVTNLQKKMTAFDEEDRENAIMEIQELVPLDAPFCSIRMEIGTDLELRFPESVTSTQDDTMLGKPIIWQRQQGIIQEQYPFDLYETIIPLKGNECLKILLSPKTDSDMQELFDIVHTLEKK